MSCDLEQDVEYRHKDRQRALAAKMQKQMTDRFVQENTPMCMPPKPLFIAVRKQLGLPVFAFMRYPMPSGKVETTYERIA
jgi:hypothetical protein